MEHRRPPNHRRHRRRQELGYAFAMSTVPRAVQEVRAEEAADEARVVQA